MTRTHLFRHWGRALVVALATGLLGATAVATPAQADVYGFGLGTRTVFDSSTPLIDARGKAVDGLHGEPYASTTRSEVSNLNFGPHGELLVAEKGGRLVYFSSLRATGGTVLTALDGSDLTKDTLTVGDTGLGGAVLDPHWPLLPFVYVFYLSNAKLSGDGTGRWTNAECVVEGACLVDARLERLTVLNRWVDGRSVPYVAARKTLIDRGWCQAANTHSVGSITFGPDGKLWLAAGDGSPNPPRTSNPGDLYVANPDQQRVCSYAVTTKYPSRYAPLDLLDPSVAPSYLGKILRVEPSTGLAPLDSLGAVFSSLDQRRARIVAMGLRNPYRMRFRPGTSTLAVSVVGQTRTEAAYVLTNPYAGATKLNAGWPCYEANDVYGSLPQCAQLSPEKGNVLKPYVSWTHHQPFVDGEACGTGDFGSSAIGVTWASADLTASGPKDYLLFGDYARGCLWARRGQDAPVFVASLPDHTVRDLTTGPDGAVYFVDGLQGAVRRLGPAGSAA